jgi:hypothetical protein
MELNLDVSQAGERSAVVRGSRVASLAALNGLGLDLTDPATLLLYSAAANHLAHGYDYRVISDPATWRADYEARYAAEDPNAPWQQGVPRLRDFGHADTSTIAAPTLDQGRVLVFVEDDYLGIPYVARFPTDTAEAATYEPLPMLSEASIRI